MIFERKISEVAETVEDNAWDGMIYEMFFCTGRKRHVEVLKIVLDSKEKIYHTFEAENTADLVSMFYTWVENATSK